MKKICPYCEKEAGVKLIEKIVPIEVKGETIAVAVEYYNCLECQNDFYDQFSTFGPLEKAYDVYRSRHNLLKPSEIKGYRKELGLNQAEMAKVLGWGVASLNRYENGSLQTEAHDKAFRLAMNIGNLIELLERTSDALPEEKRKELLQRLTERERQSTTLRDILSYRFGCYEADGYSGYKKLDLAKLFNAILFFCKEGVGKTKLCKLLFYADFKHFQEYALSITGVRYMHLPDGPVPDEYELYYATLINDEKSLKKRIIYHTEDIYEEKLTSQQEPDLSIFCESELKILVTVKEHFKDYGAKAISESSLKEPGYTETMDGEHISYEYADKLTW